MWGEGLSTDFTKTPLGAHLLVGLLVGPLHVPLVFMPRGIRILGL